MNKGLNKLMQARAEDILKAPKVGFSFLSESAQFPLVITPKLPGLILTEWVKESRELLRQKLNNHGALLFRDFEIDTVEKFQYLVSAFDSTPLEYRQRTSPRYEVAKNIYHSTTHPSDQSINMHSENSYAFKWAMNILFCCIEPAEEQGETPIADNRIVINKLNSELRDKFLQKGVKYVRNISKHIGLPWEEVFQTNDKMKVEDECKSHGMNFKWEPDEGLTLSWTNAAIYNHPVTGEQIWFNHAFFFNKYAMSQETLFAFHSNEKLPFQTFYGDGSEINKEEIEEIRMAYQKATFQFDWQKGDVLFLDNMLMAHGRRPYKGERKIIVSLF